MKIQILNQKPLNYELVEIEGEVYISPKYTSDYHAIQRLMFRRNNLPSEVKMIND